MAGVSLRQAHACRGSAAREKAGFRSRPPCLPTHGNKGQASRGGGKKPRNFRMADERKGRPPSAGSVVPPVSLCAPAGRYGKGRAEAREEHMEECGRRHAFHCLGAERQPEKAGHAASRRGEPHYPPAGYRSSAFPAWRAGPVPQHMRGAASFPLIKGAPA